MWAGEEAPGWGSRTRSPLCQCFTVAVAVVYGKTSDLCPLNRALEGILPCLFPNSLQHKQECDHFCTFSPKLFQSTTPTFFPIAMLGNPSSYLPPTLQHCLTFFLVLIFSLPKSWPYLLFKAPLSAQDWKVYWPPPLLHPCSSASQKQIKSSMQLGKLFISVGIKVTGISRS